MRIGLGSLLIKKAPRIDRDELCVRINRAKRPDTIVWYDYVHIRTAYSRITCKLRGDDIPEIKKKNINEIHINEPLRGILRVKPDEFREISIEKASRWLIPYYFIRYHPNDVVRVSTWLAFIAIVIAVIALILGILSIVFAVS